MNEYTIQRSLTLAQAIEEYFMAKRAQRLSQNTINDYTVTLKRFLYFIGADTPFSEITPSHIRDFLATLNTSNKTVRNAHVTLSSLWTWALADGLCYEHVVRKVTPPEPEQRIIKPLTYEEVKRLIAEASKRDAKRNRALILFLLDTGVRASELCSLTIENLRGNTVSVLGKGSKEREIPLSANLLHALLDYLSTRKNAGRKAPLFATKSERPLKRQSLLKWLVRLGERAGVSNVHPHRFRHTFAVTYLRNGGDALSLQRLLGHSSLDMVKKYVQLASEDLAAIHKRASPVSNWNL